MAAAKCVVGHTAYVYDRGGGHRLLQLVKMQQITWRRLGDDISLCDITLSVSQCETDLSLLEPGRHEIVVYRGQERVWEGPLTLMTLYGDRCELQARDVMHYVYRTIMRSGYDNAYPNTTTCIKRSKLILETELGRCWETLDPPIDVVDHIMAIERDNDSRTSRVTIPYEKTAFTDIDDMARASGMDYTVVGRRIVLFDTDTALGRTPVLTQEDIAGDVRITVYGMEVAAFAAVSGGDGQYGIAEGPYGYPDPYYGCWEILDDAYDEEAGSDAPTLSELADQAKRNVEDRIPTPVEVKIPEGSTLASSSPLAQDLGLLVPGVQVPVLAQLPGRSVQQIQKLRELEVTETPEGETLAITLVSTNSVLEEVEA